jgi:hypothetical protein
MLKTIRRYLGAAASSRGAAVFDVGNRITLECPSPQTALDIFKGNWISQLPGDFSKFVAGTIPLFDDPRIQAGTKHLGSVEGLNVLDLGPLEGGQPYLLQQMGAKSVVSVEANTILYLKCLVAKEVLGMDRVKFLCGDAVEYLKTATTQFDMCVASGILYHMADPVELLWLLSQRTEKLLIWTHYFDEVDTSRNKIRNFRLSKRDFRGVSYRYHQQKYGVGFFANTYCGGTARYSSWMTKDGILTALREFGYSDIDVISESDTVSGPCLLLTAAVSPAGIF